MNPLFEARYINIIWNDQNSVFKIDEAIFPISIKIENEMECNIELFTYTRISNNLNARIAFHILDDKNDIEPFFLNADNNIIPLLKIVNPANNKVWWIENGQWNSTDKYIVSALWNHVGDTKIVFGDLICNINVRANSFTREQLNLYLNDFRNDFWYLILKNDSLTQAEARGNQIRLLNNDSIDLIHKFIEFVEKVLNNPKKELREVQEIKDIKKVKPIPRTFMEIATIGFQKKLTSRNTIESYNVVENKFIYYILDKVYNVIFYMFRASEHIEEIFKKKLQNDKERIKSFTNTKAIDKEIFENEIKDLENKIKKEEVNLLKSISEQDYLEKEELIEEITNQRNISNKIASAIKNQTQINNQNQPERYIIKLDKQLDNANNMRFWGKIKKIKLQEWDNFGEKNWLILEFNDNFNFMQPNSEFEIFAKNIYKFYSTQKGIIHKIVFTNIIELKPLNKNKLEYKTLYIKLEYKQNDYSTKIQYWGKEKNNYSDEWIKLEDGDSLSLEFNKNLFDNILYEHKEYKITGYIRESFIEKKDGGKIHKRYFQYIENIEQLGKSESQEALENLESQKQNLETTNWLRPLNFREQEEQRKEKEALENITNIDKKNQQNNLKLVDNLKSSLVRLKKLLNKCKKLNIQKDSYFPNSMTFIQNPNYQGSYSFYKKINEIVGVDENLFGQLQLLEKIGLLDMPTIYERWCYLQIIKVIIDKYRFLPEDNWKTKLANQIMNNLNTIKNVEIKFKNKYIEREIDLWLEKVLDSGKRPDFLLDITSTIDRQQSHRLIMDAKFHENVKIDEQINELYPKLDESNITELDRKCPKNRSGQIIKRNYSENNKNTVFILHPDTKKAIKKRRNPAEWGNDAYYGELEMFNFNWDKDNNPLHKYGAILLSPIEKSNYIDHLQRLIGMSMQYGIEDNVDLKLGDLKLAKNILNPYPKSKQFCMQCGSHKINMVEEGYSKSNKGKFYNMECDECKHSFIYFYCWNCSYRLIKNGSYWTYHAFHVLEPFDIKCPNCEKYWVSNRDEKNLNENINTQQLITKDNYSNKSKHFINHNDGINYIKNNIGISLIKNPDGEGWITK